uniref:Uncharacterized protein n=1 Tax=Caenorhabditis tropicalis TaxID=1561998 RepID=A0A1I7U804_9PELO
MYEQVEETQLSPASPVPQEGVSNPLPSTTTPTTEAQKQHQTSYPHMLPLFEDGYKNLTLTSGTFSFDGLSIGNQLNLKGHMDEKIKPGRPRTVNTWKTRGIIKKRILTSYGVSMNKMANSLVLLFKRLSKTISD